MADENLTLGGPSPNNQGPQDLGGLGEALSKILANVAMKIENAIPVKVVSYDRVQNTAIVHPQIQFVIRGGDSGFDPTHVQRAHVGPVPVFAAGAGAYVINFPVMAGDLGWLVANDRDITNFLESLNESAPNTYRTHSFNDGVMFPDIIRNFDTTGEDGNMVIQSVDGTVKISLGQERILVKHPTKVIVDAPDSEFTGNVKIDQQLEVVGNAKFDANVDIEGTLMNGVNMTTHHHTAQGATAPTTPPQ